MKERTGGLNGQGIRVGIVVSRFNEPVTDRLLQGALDVLTRSGVEGENITVVRVPGSFEIPLAAQKLAASGDLDALICLGALIRGETSHFDYLASEVTSGIGAVSRKFDLPVSFGVLTTETTEQAMNRAGLKSGNKGAEAALAALEMANLFRD